jgi:hypothetical protein
MQGCPPFHALRRLGHKRLVGSLPGHSRRLYSYQSHQRVGVRCGSAGYVNIELVTRTQLL